MIKLSLGVTQRDLLVYDKKHLRRVMRQAGAEVAAVARAMIKRSQGAGKVYYRDGRRYQASAPGQAPGGVTGELSRGIKVRPFKSGEGVAIRDAAFYALFLEQGAKGGGRNGGRGARNRRSFRTGKRDKPQTSRVLEPRPFLSRALQQREASLGSRLRAAVQQGITFRKMKA